MYATCVYFDRKPAEEVQLSGHREQWKWKHLKLVLGEWKYPLNLKPTYNYILLYILFDMINRAIVIKKLIVMCIYISPCFEDTAKYRETDLTVGHLALSFEFVICVLYLIAEAVND